MHPRGRYECSPRAVGFYMWTFSSWEIIAAHRRACKPKQEHYVARRLWGFRHTDAVEACLRPARWARNGHLLSGYYLKNISNRIWRKELKWDSERMSKCETPPFIKSPPSLCSVFFFFASYSQLHSAIHQRMLSFDTCDRWSAAALLCSALGNSIQP